MSQIEILVVRYRRQVALPWVKNLPGAQRVWFLVYDKTEERRVRPRVDEFASATRDTGHQWRSVDVTDLFAAWMAGHDYREAYFEASFADPTAMQMALADFETVVVDRLKQELTAPEVNEETAVAVLGVGSFFGLIRVSDVLPQLEPHIRGRLVVFWPGTHGSNNYKLLDARDGWNYRAIAISAGDAI